MRVALYARYSSEQQNARSIADQHEAGRRHAAARGWTVVATFDDAAISGFAMANRPGLQALLASAEAGAFDLVLVEDEDRLARNQEHLAHVASRLEYAGVQLATLSTDRVEDMHVAFKGLIASQYLKVLSVKTARGMRSNAEKGLATGSKTFGYRSAPGGEISIVEAEAEIVRRIAERFAAGDTPRQIAAQLNIDHVPGPRGGMWNNSTIIGSRQRGNGILRTALYGGVKVWNRVEMRKDPRTGRRISRPRPQAEWRTTAVPHLRIVDDATLSAVQARLDAYVGTRPEDHAPRRPGVFSGLLRCGCCGSSYTSYNGGRLVCAAYRERGPAACTNNRMPKRRDIEQQALEALRTRLLTPEAVSVYVRAYHAAWARLRSEEGVRRAPLERRLGELDRAIGRAVDAIVGGYAGDAITARLQAMEAERGDVAAKLAAEDSSPEPPVELHPSAALGYAAIVGELQDYLARASRSDVPPDGRLIDAARGLVDEIRITPLSKERGAAVKLEMRGTLARFMEPAGMAPPSSLSGSRGALVAGASYSRAPTWALIA